MHDMHGLGHELGVLPVEVLFEEINLIVLLDAAGGTSDKLTSGLTEAQGGLLGQLSHILVDLVLLLIVILLGPTTNRVKHSVVLSWHTLSVDLKTLQFPGK